MINEQVEFEAKNGWKWFIYITETAALAGFTYFLLNLYSIISLTEWEGIFLAVIFIVMIVGAIYLIVYASRHYIIFDRKGITRYGVFRSKFIPYSEIDEIWFSGKFWDYKSGFQVLGNKNNLTFDVKYKNLEEAARFVAENGDDTSHPKVFLNKELYTASNL